MSQTGHVDPPGSLADEPCSEAEKWDRLAAFRQHGLVDLS